LRSTRVPVEMVAANRRGRPGGAMSSGAFTVTGAETVSWPASSTATASRVCAVPSLTGYHIAAHGATGSEATTAPSTRKSTRVAATPSATAARTTAPATAEPSAGDVSVTAGGGVTGTTGRTSCGARAAPAAR